MKGTIKEKFSEKGWISHLRMQKENEQSTPDWIH